MRTYSMTTPCPQCPFRSDIPAYLNAARVREIAEGLDRGTFSCHKTVDYSEEHEDGEPMSSAGELHCAGALILLEKEGRPSQMMRIAERLGVYDPSKLDMDAPVFDSFREMADAQPRRRRSRSHA